MLLQTRPASQDSVFAYVAAGETSSRVGNGSLAEEVLPTKPRRFQTDAPNAELERDTTPVFGREAATKPFGAPLSSRQALGMHRRAGSGRSSLVGAEVASPLPTANVAVPTREEMEQSLGLPLAYLTPSVQDQLSETQVVDLAQIAARFNAGVSASHQSPTDPGYAQTYQDFRDLADEQVWSVSGQAAYEALVDARAQAAGNLPPAN